MGQLLHMFAFYNIAHALKFFFSILYAEDFILTNFEVNLFNW
jgi:hypothetical protein